MSSKSLTNLLLIYTGGTIGMQRLSPGGSLRPFEFEKLLDLIPEIKLIPAQIDYQSFNPPLDSSNMDPQHWIKLGEIIERNYEKYDGFVVLHGTDTMAYTASALSFMFKGLKKPIIFTGSQLPIGDLRTDAKENLISSLEFATIKEKDEPAVQEVCVYFEYKLYRGNRTTKISAAHFNAFESPNFPDLGESGVRLDLRSNNLWRTQNEFGFIPQVKTKVGLLKIFPGMPFDSFFCFNPNQLDVLIVESFGSGNVFDNQNFINYLKDLSSNDTQIIIASQCVRGRVNLGLYNSSEVLLNLGAISGHDLTTEAAITKSMILTGRGYKGEQFKQLFTTNLRGELQVL